MARYVFHPGELQSGQGIVFLKPPYPLENEPEELLELEAIEEEYSGPTPSELKAEAEEFKRQWEAEKETLKDAARRESEEIILAAQSQADAIRAQIEETGKNLREKAEAEAAGIVAEAERKAKEILDDAQQKYASDKKTAEDTGRQEGKSEGFEEGKAEAERLIARIHTVLEHIQEKRAEIFDECERQVVDLSLLVARKVVKTLIAGGSEEIVKANVEAALEKVRGKGTVIVRVNLADLDLATKYKEDFVRLMEAKGAGTVSLRIHEDTSVDKGGCVVETDFGEIDARIASQLSEMENRILEISPQKQKRK